METASTWLITAVMVSPTFSEPSMAIRDGSVTSIETIGPPAEFTNCTVCDAMWIPTTVPDNFTTATPIPPGACAGRASTACNSSFDDGAGLLGVGGVTANATER